MEELRDSQRLLRATLDALEANIAVLDESGTILTVNAAWEAFAAANGMGPRWNGVGSSYLEVCDRARGPDRVQARAAAQGIRALLDKQRSRFELEYPCHAPHEERWFVLRATAFEAAGPMRVVVAHENVTERKRAELGVRRSERLASIGTLAGGMAHEINNPIGAVLLAAREAQAHLDERPRAAALLDQIVANAKRCGEIVQSLLRSVGTTTAGKSLHDVNEILAECAELLRPWAEQRNVSLRVEQTESLPRIRVVQDDLRLAFFNLGANAIQACEAGGHVSIRSYRVGDRLRVRVQDDGRGMTDEEQTHAFDPFYSRRVGEMRAGLGLTLCHTVVSDHGGRIEVESRPGEGTCITLDLPIA